MTNEVMLAFLVQILNFMTWSTTIGIESLEGHRIGASIFILFRQ